MGTTIEQLREHVRGSVITANAEGYDEARKVYNAMIDRRPRVIVRCTNAADVAATVDFARENQLALAVRGGGHSVPGFGTVDDGVVGDEVTDRFCVLGSTSEVIDKLHELADAGVDQFNVYLMNGDEMEQLDLIAQQVVPVMRGVAAAKPA